MSDAENSRHEDQAGHSVNSPRQSSSTDFNAIDAVSLFNNKIDFALKTQRVEIVSELKDKFKNSSDFKGEGNKIQFAFNEERLQNLDTLENKIKFGDLLGAQSLIESERKAVKFRNKLLKLADKHGWDAVKEYTDSDIADNAEDAAKIRSAVSRAAAKKRNTQSFTPYPKSAPSYAQRNPGVFDGLSNRQLFLGAQAGGYYPRQQAGHAQRPSYNYFSGYRPTFGSSGFNGLCNSCGLPGHISRFCPYNDQFQQRQPPSATATRPDNKQ